MLDLYFTTIQGVLLQNSGLDSGFDDIVDALLHELRSVTTRIRPSQLMARSYEHNSKAGILNTSFPDYSVWSIPVIVHELGHLVIADLRLDLQAAVLAACEMEPRERTERIKSSSDELFCDSFATFVMGPSYPCSLILLYAKPLDTSDSKWFPSTLTRIRMCALMLQRPGRTDKQQPDDMMETFTRALAAYLDEFDQMLPPQPYPTELVPMAHVFYQLLIAEFPSAAADLSARDQRRISHLAAQLKHQSKSDTPADTTIRDVLNAGWLARLQGNADPGVRVRETIQDLIAAQTPAT